ncbi:tyrosine-type recombinase/integrase [Boseaceae bacterium BT-24-1]|nr:tyrosine-type recombinase/integrase [Boseaceae bacterium BT-24-1]
MINDMPRPRYPHALREHSRHGKSLWYFRRGKGKRIRLPDDYGSEEFKEAYEAALVGETLQKKPAGGAGTLRWLWLRYQDSGAWSDLSNATRRQRENIMKHVLETGGDKPLSAITRKAVVAGRDRRKATPAMARHFVETMRGIFRWAVDAEHVKEDPTRDVKVSKPKTEGHHTWTDDECDMYEAKWPLGTRERLAFDILLYTGFRRGDASRFGRQHVRSGMIHMTTEKGQGKVTVVLPLLQPLADSITATKTGDMVFIAKADGTAMSKEGFGNWFAEACVAAGVPGRAHGLRKAGATRAANRGASDAQLDAIFGWSGRGMAALYTKKANRTRLAQDAASFLIPEPKSNVYPRTSSSGAGNSLKK